LPTAKNFSKTINTDQPVTFAETDFKFSDTDNRDTLTEVKITQLETNGTLTLSGSDVTINKVITIADIQDEKLIFTPDNGEKGTPYATFKFQVSDGNEYSAASYTATINVNNAAPTSADFSKTINTDGTVTLAASDFGFADDNTGSNLQTAIQETPLPK